MTPDEGFRMLDDDAAWPLALERREVPSRRMVAPVVARVAVGALVVALCGGAIAGALALRGVRQTASPTDPNAPFCSVAGLESRAPVPEPTQTEPAPPPAVRHATNDLYKQLAHAANGATPGSFRDDDRGLAYLGYDPTTSGVIVRWVGEPPADVQSIIAGTDPRVRVTLDTSATVTLRQTSAAFDAIGHAFETLKAGGTDITAVFENGDGPGTLSVEVYWEGRSLAEADAKRADAERAIEAVGGVPVVVHLIDDPDGTVKVLPLLVDKDGHPIHPEPTLTPRPECQ